MKKIVLASALTAALLAWSGGNGYGNGANGKGQGNYMQASSTTYTLTQEQKEGLLFMYEEEKLAHDVYERLGEQWNLRLFYRIKEAEIRHMQSVGRLLDKYGITRPITTTQSGIYNNSELQSLYDTLMKKGMLSVKDALEVGKMIEEEDIADLEERIKTATPDLKAVYENLLAGSKKHLSAFKRNLESY